MHQCSLEKLAVGIQARISLLEETADTVREERLWLPLEPFGYRRRPTRIVASDGFVCHKNMRLTRLREIFSLLTSFPNIRVQFVTVVFDTHLSPYTLHSAMNVD